MRPRFPRLTRFRDAVRFAAGAGASSLTAGFVAVWLKQTRVRRRMLQVIVAAILILQRPDQHVRLFLEPLQRDDRHRVERAVATLGEGADPACLAEAVLQVRFVFTSGYPRVIAQVVLAFSHLEIFRWNNREPEARLGADRAVAAGGAVFEVDPGLEGDGAAVTRAMIGFLRHRFPCFG